MKIENTNAQTKTYSVYIWDDKKIELKCCPFCGGEPIYMDKTTAVARQNPTIECLDCCCSMIAFPKEFLIDCWEKRV